MKLFNIFKHKHKWETTHTNKWMIPTRQICGKCGIIREASTSIANAPLTYHWVYSDGTISEPFELGEGL